MSRRMTGLPHLLSPGDLNFRLDLLSIIFSPSCCLVRHFHANPFVSRAPSNYFPAIVFFFTFLFVFLLNMKLCIQELTWELTKQRGSPLRRSLSPRLGGHVLLLCR